MSLVKRVQLLEKHFGTDDGDTTPEAVLIFTQDCSLEDVPPMPITKFSFNGLDIHRLPDEPYPAFEFRAIKEAIKQLPPRQTSRQSRPMPTPCLIADGSKQE